MKGTYKHLTEKEIKRLVDAFKGDTSEERISSFDGVKADILIEMGGQEPFKSGGIELDELIEDLEYVYKHEICEETYK